MEIKTGRDLDILEMAIRRTPEGAARDRLQSMLAPLLEQNREEVLQSLEKKREEERLSSDLLACVYPEVLEFSKHACVELWGALLRFREEEVKV